LRFGLLGTGYWAEHTQAAALSTHPEAEFVGVWGRNPAKAEALARRYGVRPYPDVDALIADVDAVAVALPPDVQADLAVRAAEAGRHLLLDKPLALSTAAADRVVSAVRDRGVASLVFFTNRYRPNVREFLARTAADGPWHGARASVLASIFEPGNPYGGSPWRREKGGLWDVGPHALAIVVPVLGPVERVAALDGPRDSVHLLLGHREGAVTTMSLTLDAAPAAAGSETVFYGEPGVVAFPADDATPVEAFGVAIADLARNAAAGTVADPLDVAFGRDVVAVLEAAETARREGDTVSVAATA
jgi:predicted dehydrogenase